MAERTILQTAENAKGDYEREQARQYIRNKMRETEQRATMNDAAANGGQSNVNRVNKILSNDEVYKSYQADEHLLAEGNLNDALLLRYANLNVAARQERENRSASTQEKIDNSFNAVRERQANGEYVTIDDVGQEMVNQGGSYTRMGPDGIVTSDPHYFDAMKEGVQGSFHGETYDELEIRKFMEYGNNYFSLFTYIPGQDEKIPFVADGVMTELPPVSFSTEWANSPAASVGEKLDETLNNDFIEFLGMRAADASTPVMRRKDALTTRVYKDAGEMKFQVKFRIYPGQKIGNRQMTNVKEWLLFLSLTTPINAACSFSVSNTFGNIIKTADGIANAFKELRDYISGDNNSDDVDPNVANVLKAQLGSSTSVDSLYSFQNAAARIANANVFGACVFGLRIYPWIFKQALTVYISDWSVEPSKEWNETVNDHYFYDFTLNCELDQKPSANTWAKEILKDTGF